MQIRIDYFGFTLKREPQNDDDEPRVLEQVYAALMDRHRFFYEIFDHPDNWHWMSGRKPYRACYGNELAGVFIFVHPALPHSLIEITGRGCEALGSYRYAHEFLSAFSDRATRLDIACDMMTETRPKEFVSQRDEKRFKSDGHINEESGETEVVGSKKSNRFAVVYRYNPPHERSHLLRCEFRVKGEDAKRTAEAVLKDGQDAVAKALGEQFGWKHPDWVVEAPTEAELRAYRPDRKQGKTLFWLSETIAPLIARLHREGVINATEWFRDNVLREIDPDTAT